MRKMFFVYLAVNRPAIRQALFFHRDSGTHLVGFIILAYSLRNIGMLKLTLIILILGFLFASVPSGLIWLKKRQLKKEGHKQMHIE